MGAIPLPPKQTIEEHNRTQSTFLREKLEPVLRQARAKRRSVFFVDAAHFVQGSFLCCVWCLVRMFVRGSSGRRRYNVLGAWNGVTRELIRVTNGAHNALLDLEELEEQSLDGFRSRYQALATSARAELDKGNSDTGTPDA